MRSTFSKDIKDLALATRTTPRVWRGSQDTAVMPLDDKQLLARINANSQSTQQQVAVAAQENEQFQAYLGLQQTIAGRAEEYLQGTQTTFQAFKSLLRDPSTTGWERLRSKLTFGRWKSTLTPQKVGGIVLDLYSNMVQHKSAVEQSHDLIQNRRTIITDAARHAAENIREHGGIYAIANAHFERVAPVFASIDGMAKEEQPYDVEVLRSGLVVLKDSGLYNGRELIDGIDAGEDVQRDLYLIREDLDEVRRELDAQRTEAGLETKGSKTMLEGLDLQKDQYAETVKGLQVQAVQLDVDLRYTQVLAQNTFYLATAQGVSHAALTGFETYRAVMNDAQLFNSMGARLMLDRIGHLLVTPFFDEEKLSDAREELDTAKELFSQKEEEFHIHVGGLVETINNELPPGAKSLEAPR
ncbi:hypothetical protein CMO91_03375 [Candidatus Woesearchaeota archaeon]|nr:hypothetical protein [Candidatus Woesearchaeota archaeon]